MHSLFFLAILWSPCASAFWTNDSSSSALTERVERLEAQYRTDLQIQERSFKLTEAFNQRTLDEQAGHKKQLEEKYDLLEKYFKGKYELLEKQLEDTRRWTDSVITFWMTISGLLATIFGIGIPLITQRKYAAKLDQAQRQHEAKMEKEIKFLDLKARSMVTDNKSEKMALYDQMIELQPSSFHVYTMRGDLFLELDSYSKTIADYDQAIKLVKEDLQSPTPNSSQEDLSYIYWKRGRVALRYSEYDDAATFYDLALGLTPNDAQVLLSRGHVSYNTNDNGEALTYYKEAQKHSKEGDYIHCICSGHVARESKKYIEAVKLFTTAIELHPKSFEAIKGALIRMQIKMIFIKQRLITIKRSNSILEVLSLTTIAGTYTPIKANMRKRSLTTILPLS